MSTYISKFTGNEIDEKIGLVDSKQDIITDITNIRTGASKGITAVQPEELADVATSGDYNDLINKPQTSLPSVTVEDNGKALIVINGKWDKGSGGGSGDYAEVAGIANTVKLGNQSMSFSINDIDGGLDITIIN